MAKKIKSAVAEVDVTSAETHASVQCEDIRLIVSSLKPLLVDTDRDTSTRFAFRVRATIEGQKAFSYLEVKVNHFFKEQTDGLQGFNLSYVLMGTFSTSAPLKPRDFAHFIKMNTVTILWPYAREYASDQFRRAGNHEIVLPIINPQVVTKQIVENNLVDVEIIKQPK
jgi:preprotein translocase subunit SecB